MRRKTGLKSSGSWKQRKVFSSFSVIERAFEAVSASFVPMCLWPMLKHLTDIASVLVWLTTALPALAIATKGTGAFIPDMRACVYFSLLTFFVFAIRFFAQTLADTAFWNDIYHRGDGRKRRNRSQFRSFEKIFRFRFLSLGVNIAIFIVQITTVVAAVTARIYFESHLFFALFMSLAALIFITRHFFGKVSIALLIRKNIGVGNAIEEAVRLTRRHYGLFFGIAAILGGSATILSALKETILSNYLSLTLATTLFAWFLSALETALWLSIVVKHRSDGESRAFYPNAVRRYIVTDPYFKSVKQRYDFPEIRQLFSSAAYRAENVQSNHAVEQENISLNTCKLSAEHTIPIQEILSTSDLNPPPKP